MPQNKGGQPITYTLTLTAQVPGGKAKTKKKVTVTVLPEATQIADKELIATGYGNSCTVVTQGTKKGKVLCWGSKELGDLGDEGSEYGYSSTPVTVANVDNAVEIASGGEHTCALLSTGHIKCWGATIGIGNGGRRPPFAESTPVAVVNIDNAVQIAGGFETTCALLATGHVSCWGFDTIGQIGPMGVDGVEVLEPREIPSLADALEVTAGREATCARLEGGAVDCWGGNGHGQFGDEGRGPEHFTPFPVEEVKGASMISAGDLHICAVVHEEGHPAGQVKCWGWGESGQLGDDNFGYHRKPEDVVEGHGGGPSIHGVVQVTAANEHSCALFKEDGTVKCWGSDAKGQLGDGGTIRQTIAVPVGGKLEHVVEIDAALWHTCALLEDGTIKCWGSDAAGELGNGTTEPSFSSTPVTVSGFPPVSAAARRETARRKAHRKRRKKKHS